MTPEKLLAERARYEPAASLIVREALAEGRSAELLLSLMAGAACALDQSRRLEIVWLNKPAGNRRTHDNAGGLDSDHALRQALTSSHEPRTL